MGGCGAVLELKFCWDLCGIRQNASQWSHRNSNSKQWCSEYTIFLYTPMEFSEILIYCILRGPFSWSRETTREGPLKKHHTCRLLKGVGPVSCCFSLQQTLVKSCLLKDVLRILFLVFFAPWDSLFNELVIYSMCFLKRKRLPVNWSFSQLKGSYLPSAEC